MSRKHKQLNKSPQELVDIVIPVYNNFELLGECLNAIPKAIGEIPYTIIIVDNASTEENGFYKTIPRSIGLLRNRSNLGFPKACNQGVNRGDSPLIFLLNSDIVLEPMSIDFLVRTMDDPEVGVVGMRLKFPTFSGGLEQNIRPPDKVQHVGMSVNIRSEWVHSFIGWDIDHPRVMMQSEVYGVTGAAFMTRRNLWRKIGGFFEGYGRGTYEDVDYCMSIHEMKLKVMVEPKALGTHYTGATAERYKLGYNLNENRMLFESRWQNKLKWTEYLQV